MKYISNNIIRIIAVLFPVVFMMAGCMDHIRTHQRPQSNVDVSAGDVSSEEKILSEGKTVLGGKSLVGQRLWFVPNLKAIPRIGFAKSTMHKDLVSKQLYYPTETVVLQVVQKVYGNGRTKRNKYYRVQFEDGSSAFIEDMRIELALSRFTTSPLTKQNVDRARGELFDIHNLGSMFSETFFKEDPMKIKNKIAEIDKAIKKTEAERQARGAVRIGMSEGDILASSWGKPIEINRTVVKGIISEQWVYSGQSYLYFTNGKLSGIQNKK